jgi:hypothetical protein
MWHRMAITAGILYALFFRSAAAAEPANPPGVPGKLITDCKWLTLDMVLGRLTITEARLGKDLKAAARCPNGTWNETLTFSARSVQAASLVYRFTDQAQQWTVEIERGNYVSLARQPMNGSDVVSVRFTQPAIGELRLAVDDAQNPRDINSPSFWHLMLGERALCQQYLLPMLESLHTDWRLDIQAEHVGNSLVAAANAGLVPDTDRITRLIAALSSDNFQQRQSADRELREIGPLVVPFIDRLDVARLDAEQRQRLRRIRDSLTATKADSAERVAAWLIHDKTAWFAMLQHEQPETRQVAMRQLVQITGRPLEFDVAGDERTRQLQINRLRRELGLTPAVQVGNTGTTPPRR